MTRNLVFEIGVEEMPSGALYGAIEQLQVAVPKALDNARIEYDEISVFGAPRRLVISVTELSEHQANAVNTFKGPSAAAAFAEDGAPTKAAIGFARGKGVGVESLTVVDDEAGAYVYAIVEVIGGPATEVLPTLLARLAESIEWPRSQRWGSGDARFTRPVRWLLALFGGETVPVEFAGLVAGRITRGHRLLAPGEIEVPTADEYARALSRGKVVADQAERAKLIREGISTVAEQIGGRVVVPEKTFAEVVNLVEYPTVAVGTFDEAFLKVPREILENAMGSHQRYFPVESSDGTLTNRFVVAHNGDPARTDAIVRGHERVIRARLSDAAFFFQEDLANPLESYVAKLDKIVFQTKLGSLGDKTRRVESLAEKIAELTDAGPDEAAYAIRAAHLAKADLVTSAVIEFTDLQGVMGGYYAAAAGEEPGVVSAIMEHYRPRFAGDALPATAAGRIVALADKFDTIVGIFAAGKAPTGSADPFALRRAAIGILQIMLDAKLSVGLNALVTATLEGYQDVLAFDSEASGGDVKAFFTARLDGLLRERGNAYDTVAAVLAVAADDPADALARCEALTALRESSDDMEDLSVAFSRARNIAQADLGTRVDRALMGAEESALADALDVAEGLADTLISQRAHSALLESFAGLRGPIDEFFTGVLVMDPDSAVRENRLRLLNRFIALFARFADFSRLAG
ncbi:MAG: glycine--tRNA ligase subunit beta [Coriobacteriia bacterium]|nr:glycine--tRNA ligase subunit beta [Coriobacteriia bacterium]